MIGPCEAQEIVDVDLYLHENTAINSGELCAIAHSLRKELATAILLLIVVLTPEIEGRFATSEDNY
uniref:Uncharacterized protein n=1 Tax=Romanomermis culicivorax TaxID=13658 RepID=A0A915HVU9_ROMCU